MSNNPFTAKAKKHKLKPFGGASKAQNGNGNGKINPFAVVAKKIDLDTVQLEQIDADLKAALKEYEQSFKEEKRLFKTVDRLALRGQTHTEKYSEAKGAWDVAWRRVERAYGAMQTLSARRNKIRGPHART